MTMQASSMGTLDAMPQSTLPQKEIEAEKIKMKSRALDIADGLLMIIFAFALWSEIYSVFLYAWN